MVLGAGRTEGSAGNAFSNAAIESAGDIVAASSGRNASVTVNAASDGTVEGDFKFYGEDNAFRFTNDIRVAGDALVNAAAIHGTSLEAEGRLELIAALYDDGLPEGAPEGIAFKGNLSGTTAAVFTNAGDIRIGGRIEATEGYLDVYRLSTGASGVVAVNEAKGPSVHDYALQRQRQCCRHRSRDGRRYGVRLRRLERHDDRTRQSLVGDP